MEIATNEFLEELEALKINRINEIKNAKDELCISEQTYYVSADGCDQNDGLSPESAWRTLERVSSADLKVGDGVLFHRGDLFRGMVYAQEGVSYGAFGKGEKPKFYAWREDLADPELWEQSDKTNNIWKYKKGIADVGSLVFNGGEKHSLKHIPSYICGKFVCREDESKPFLMENEMKGNLDIYWHFEKTLTTKNYTEENLEPVPEVENITDGELYLRCDEGNPGEVFDSIEAIARTCAFRTNGKKNITIDNICMKYYGVHAVAAGGPLVEGLKVTNCEIGWIGGTIQNYYGLDPNYPQGGRGTVTRFGNGVEIYGGCRDYEVSNCYIYEIYDAGVTHQVTTNGKKYVMEDIRYKDNLIDKNVYSIEYFLDMNKGDVESYMKGIEISGNILMNSGFGWGQQRHNKHTPAHIKGWSYVNRASDFKIHDNIFAFAGFRMLHLVALDKESLPEMWSNTYIQTEGGMLGQYGENCEKEPEIEIFDTSAEEKIERIFKDSGAKVYIVKK